jgi:hypothetical protein
LQAHQEIFWIKHISIATTYNSGLFVKLPNATLIYDLVINSRKKKENVIEEKTCKWSNSCWKTRAGRPDKLTVNLAPLMSLASIFTDSGL